MKLKRWFKSGLVSKCKNQIPDKDFKWPSHLLDASSKKNINSHIFEIHNRRMNICPVIFCVRLHQHIPLFAETVFDVLWQNSPRAIVLPQKRQPSRPHCFGFSSHYFLLWFCNCQRGESVCWGRKVLRSLQLIMFPLLKNKQKNNTFLKDMEEHLPLYKESWNSTQWALRQASKSHNDENFLYSSTWSQVFC